MSGDCHVTWAHHILSYIKRIRNCNGYRGVSKNINTSIGMYFHIHLSIIILVQTSVPWIYAFWLLITWLMAYGLWFMIFVNVVPRSLIAAIGDTFCLFSYDMENTSKCFWSLYFLTQSSTIFVSTRIIAFSIANTRLEGHQHNDITSLKVIQGFSIVVFLCKLARDFFVLVV